MPRSIELAELIEGDDGTVRGLWDSCTLESAFQPIFGFAGDRLAAWAFEGLLRPSRAGRAVGPGAFFASIAPERRVEAEALARRLHLLNARGCFGPDCAIFINFNPALFAARPSIGEALATLEDILAITALPAARVICEVTEQPTQSEAALRAFTQALRRAGHPIAVDDYGSKSSDIARIRRLAPDIVKFDAGWVARLMADDQGVARLHDLVAELAGQGISTILEGIEEPRQLEIARASGAGMVQGFALCRPTLAPAALCARGLVDEAREAARHGLYLHEASPLRQGAAL